MLNNMDKTQKDKSICIYDFYYSYIFKNIYLCTKIPYRLCIYETKTKVVHKNVSQCRKEKITKPLFDIKIEKFVSSRY